MKSKVIHQHDDWYMIHLPVYGDIPKEELEVDINVTDNALINMDYKALRGAMIMERYEEKRERNVVEELEVHKNTTDEKLIEHANLLNNSFKLAGNENLLRKLKQMTTRGFSCKTTSDDDTLYAALLEKYGK